MSHSRLPRKLQPAKKALKRFAEAVQTKLHNLDYHKAIKVVKTNTRRFLAYCSVHFFLPLKRRFITRSSHDGHLQHYRHLYHSYSSKSQLYNNFSPIYIDRLYHAEAASTVTAKHFQEGTSSSSSSRGKEVVNHDHQTLRPRREGKTEKEKILYSIEDAWQEAVAKSPQLRPVDERAEEFISKFRQDMQLQKEMSKLEFDEMLARGT